MGNILYLWNDLDLFEDSQKRSKMLWEKMNEYLLLEKRDKEKLYYCFGENLKDEWLKELGGVKDKFVISPGTRPTILLNKKGIKNFLQIQPQRIRNSQGSTKGIDIDDTEKKKIREYCSKSSSEIFIVEDAIVNGETIKFLLDEIQESGFKGRVIVKVLFGNRRTINNIKNRYAFDIEYEVKKWMEGLPIEGSTLICMHDLLYGEIEKGIPYYERIDLLERFIPNDKKKLYDLLKALVKI